MEKEVITLPEPLVQPEEPLTPEKIKEKPAPTPNPFTIPTPQIQPGQEPSPKA
ncbi:MAG: hypothetical protein WC875_02310 [Candidatus Absconditabacterales bacterium]|jgi:hypothetical protein